MILKYIREFSKNEQKFINLFNKKLGFEIALSNCRFLIYDGFVLYFSKSPSKLKRLEEKIIRNDNIRISKIEGCYFKGRNSTDKVHCMDARIEIYLNECLALSVARVSDSDKYTDGVMIYGDF